MTIILLVFPLLLIGTVVVAYFYYRTAIYDVARSLQNKKAFTPFNALPPREAIPVIKSSTGEEFARKYLPDALSNLVNFTNAIAPDWIVGVHPGGRFLSVLLAEQIGFPANRCLYVRTSNTDANKIVFARQRFESNLPREGKMLVVDDISRTGRTLHLLKRYLIAKNYTGPCAVKGMEECYRLSKVHFAALLVVLEEGAVDIQFRPDFCVYRTADKFFRLPWSKFAAKVDEAFAMKHQGMAADSRILAQYEQMSQDYDYAVELVREQLGSLAPQLLKPPLRAAG
jgi:hypoxanthine phosphoribosyltransferase